MRKRERRFPDRMYWPDQIPESRPYSEPDEDAPPARRYESRAARISDPGGMTSYFLGVMWKHHGDFF